MDFSDALRVLLFILFIIFMMSRRIAPAQAALGRRPVERLE